MKRLKLFFLLVFVFMFPTVLVVNSQNTQPDYVTLEFDTVPNVLLVEIISTTATSDGVEVMFKVGNPLRSLYLPFSFIGDPAELELVSETDFVWHNIGLVPPADLFSLKREFTYRVLFTSTDQYLGLESRALDLRSIVFNGIEIAANHFLPNVPATDQIANALHVVEWEQYLTSITANLQCLSDEPLSLQDARDCALLAIDLFTQNDEVGEQFRNLVVAVLRELGANVNRSAVDLFIDGREFLSRWANVSDSLVYGGLLTWAGQFYNRYNFRPITLDPSLRPPWPPRLNAPLGFTLDRLTRFEWNSVPDVDYYELQVDTDPEFSSEISRVQVPETYFIYPDLLQTDVTYYWRVRAVNSRVSQPSPWSTGAFTIGTESEVVPLPVENPQVTGDWRFSWENQRMDCGPTDIIYYDFITTVANAGDNLSRLAIGGAEALFQRSNDQSYSLINTGYNDLDATVRSETLHYESSTVIVGERTDYFADFDCSVTNPYRMEFIRSVDRNGIEGAWAFSWETDQYRCEGGTITYYDFTTNIRNEENRVVSRNAVSGTIAYYELDSENSYSLQNSYNDLDATVLEEHFEVVSPDRIIGSRTDDFPGLCTATISYTMERISGGATCNLIATQIVNLRGGPGTNYDRVGQLQSGQSLRVGRQMRGEDGFIWYQSTEDGTWVRSDVINVLPACSDLQN